MGKAVLVTGANGHLGNNLVRVLLAKGEMVRAGVRKPEDAKALVGLECSRVKIDLLDKVSLRAAMDGVDVVYLVAAVFKHWARDPEQAIYQQNMQGTKNALEAAAEAGVRRVVYVSSLAALDRSQRPITETNWNPVRSNVYFRSKTDSERLALELADRLALDLVSVLPGAMIGQHCFQPTPTMGVFTTILSGKLPVDPGFFFNFVDVVDVAEACWQAAQRGRRGERYLLANEKCTSVAELVALAQQAFPKRGIKTPLKPPRPALYAVVCLMECLARVRGVEPELQRNYLRNFTVPEYCDISKARRDLAFSPKPPQQAVVETLRCLARD